MRLDVLQEVALATQHHTVTDAQAVAASGTRALQQEALSAHAVAGQTGRSLSLLWHALESTCSGEWPKGPGLRTAVERLPQVWDRARGDSARRGHALQTMTRSSKNLERSLKTRSRASSLKACRE